MSLEGTLEVIWTNPPTQAAIPSVGGPGPCQAAFEHLRAWRPHHLSKQLVSMLCHPQKKIIKNTHNQPFPYVQTEPLCFCTCPLSPVLGLGSTEMNLLHAHPLGICTC